MAQKNKVKELVGRGLNSYHTKALQQIHRIEKKNKEQNHKISILSNELDNDYLTKTEEGSVVSLEHSKEGMIYLDELQGNTLVNYCTDGSKEITLNGDIDVEGTFVTTTEGVDNGKVDVLCEGNTLVNLINRFDSIQNNAFTKDGNIYKLNAGVAGGLLFKTTVKPNTTYTLFFDVYKNTNTLGIFMDAHPLYIVSNEIEINLNKGFAVFSTKADLSSNTSSSYNFKFGCHTSTNGELWINNFVLLEGDLRNSEKPNYFIGMKSVGQDDTNGHKIEILSKNKNLFKNASLSTKTSWETFNGTIVEGINNNKGIYSEHIQTSHGYYDFLQQSIFLKDNINNAIKNDTWYTFSFYAKGTGKVRTHIYPKAIDSSIKGFVNGVEKNLQPDGNCDWELTNEWVRHSYTFKTKSNINDMGTFTKALFRLMPSDTDILNTVTISCPMLEEGKVATNFVNDLSNKKEILINEPLRGLPNGVKDKIVKIGGKWYIERNCKVATVDDLNVSVGYRFDDYNTCSIVANLKTSNALINRSNPTMMCNTIPHYIKHNYGAYTEYNYISLWADNTAFFVCQIRGLSSVEEYYDYFRNNNCLFLYPLAKPTYEEIIDMELTTYLDITHISNNSIIPCNMVVKNSGYNAIIKPSTLYTVALDTNKSGTIGMNLGGAKGTTTNNVLKLTTPATLTDDSLRLYGKGIKGSKVRLLEGDKTNWIPSHFEGMKSSFEDKVQSDGSYKMEILSNNKNLFDIDAKRYYAGWGEHNYQKYKNGFSFCSKNGWNSIGYTFENLKNKTVTVCATVTCVNKDISKQQEQPFSIIPVEYGYPTSVRFRDGETKKVKFNITLKDNGRVYFIGASNNEGSNKGGIQWFLEDISVVEGIENDYIPRECNKIQFSSIEPLRGVDNIKDKFVFKDGRLMIERNCSKYTTVGTENWIRHDYSNSNKIFAYARVTSMNDRKAYTNIYCNNFATYLKSAEELKNQNNEYIWKGNASHSTLWLWISNNKFDGVSDINKFKTWVKNNPITVTYQLAEPTYEEIPFELQKIILEGYENGTLFFDTNIPPTSAVRYAGETPIVKATKLNKTEVLSNTEDINDNIIPYLMDMDYRVVCLQLQSEEFNNGVSMARLFGGAYEMLQRDIQSRRYSGDEYKHRLDAYLDANKITEEEYNKLGDMLNE